MEIADDLQSQLHQVVEDLSPVQQAEVLDFALFLKERQLAWGWDSISDKRATALKAEFAAEDTAFSEAILTDYPDLLKREDMA
ncbi:MAG: hypothetical protein NT118_01505 [Lentisphaerae bacterium]|nr:hypothetical protein [Lentisphaerota bacterium]